MPPAERDAKAADGTAPKVSFAPASPPPPPMESAVSLPSSPEPRHDPRTAHNQNRRHPQSQEISGFHPHCQPTLPSICNSISRLHSTAYSIGRVRVTGSMKPLTIKPMACSSVRPRLCR